MTKFVAKTGNETIAEAMRQINPDVVAAYPITPATEIVQIFAQFVADGRVKTEFVAVESEHSALSAVIGASAAGSRAMTATASQGLALMWEMLYIASGLRLPIVMPVVNRALSAPINIHCDHSDTMGARDAGWIQLFSENSQEAYDNLIMAVKIAETALVPVMVTIDGFIISHGMEAVQLLPDSEVTGYIGAYKPEHSLLDVDHPKTFGAIDFTDYYFEHKRSQIEAMINSHDIICDISRAYSKKFGRDYACMEKYRLDDAEIAIVVLGSTAGTTKAVVDELREKGIKAGLLKLRVFRPFPYKEIKETLSPLKSVAVLDRSDCFNSFGGPLFMELRSALYGQTSAPRLTNYIYGLGGRDITLAHLKSVYQALIEGAGEEINYLGVRE